MMRGSAILRLDSAVLGVVVLVVVLLLSLPRAAVGILGFDDEAGSCALSRALASEVLTLEVAGCDAFRAPCSASTDCENCIWVPDDKAVASCSDGCAYCDTVGNCVERVTSAVRGVGIVDISTQQYIVLQNLGLTYTFTAGNYTGTTFILLWEPGFQGTCSAKFSDQDCVCAQYYCDESQTDYGYTADCTAIPGGTVLNTCLPDAGLLWQDNSTIMDILVMFPSRMCQQGVEETTSTAPPSTTIDANSGTTTDGGGPGTTTTTTTTDGSSDTTSTGGTTEEGSTKPSTGVISTTGESPTTTATTTDGTSSSNAAASFKKRSGFPYLWTASCLSWSFLHAFVA
jgi:hypothetical protein